MARLIDLELQIHRFHFWCNRNPFMVVRTTFAADRFVVGRLQTRNRKDRLQDRNYLPDVRYSLRNDKQH